MSLYIPIYVYIYFFVLVFGFIDRTAEVMTGNRLRERGSDMQQRAPSRDSNPQLV